MSYHSLSYLKSVAGGMLLGICALQAHAQSNSWREFPPGSLNELEDLPVSRLRTELEQMPSSSKERAVQWLRSFHFTEADLPSLHVDSAGGIFYVCNPTRTVAITPVDAPVISEAAVPVSPFPSHLCFHSKPGAPNILYVNFSGMTVTNTEWNTVVGRSEIPALPFSTDSDTTTFSDVEQVAIKRIWQRMSEDYAPFNIDVTTEPPASLSTRTAVALVTRTTDANGDPNPSNMAGGVAYVNAFGTASYASYRPAWIYHGNLANDESFIAEAASHEVGHNLGLSHDGRPDGYEYYGGHGSGDISWGPLMGTGYYRNVSHWSKGDYYLASNTQDDLATIAGKISYRADDHGNTTGTATALIVTSGTNILSTTSETDPANSNTVNKGVLDRNTDLDVFSFVTGTGPVKLAVNPWIMPSGTRGGNADFLVELYDEAGTLLLTNNPSTQTIALIETNLVEGRYFIQVRNSGAGDPYSSAPSGYTSYGSLGQYFISGFVTEAPKFIVAPVAQLETSDLTQPGQVIKEVRVSFSDDVAVDVSSIDPGDLRVTGPNGYDRLAQTVALDLTSDGTPRRATYSFSSASGSTWSAADNGVYTVWVRTNEVADTEGAWVRAGELGQFRVAVPVILYTANMDTDPGWTLEPDWQYGIPSYSSGGPAAGFTGNRIIAYNLAGAYGNNLSARYAISPPINCTGASSLSLRFKRWLRTKQNDPVTVEASTNGSIWVVLWSSSTAVSDSTWQEVQYPLPESFTGCPSLRLRWSLASNASQTDIGWNLDDVELLSEGVVDTVPPAAVVTVANLTVGGAQSHVCYVTYTDTTAVRLASLDSTDLAVTGPNGYSNLLQFISADLPADGSPITAGYSMAAPSGSWDSADNGTYTLTLLAGSVQDTLTNATAQASLGSFDVSITTTAEGAIFVSPAGELSASGTVGGPFSPGSMVYTLTNSGGSSLNWIVSKGQTWLNLSADSGSLAAGASTNITVSINSGANILEAGSYSDSVAFANITTGSGNTSRAVSLTVNSPGLLAVSPIGELNGSGTVGGPFSPGSMVYTLTNSGGSSLNWIVSKGQSWLSLSADSGSLAAGASTNITVSIGSGANILEAGSYSDSVAFANITTGSGNTSRGVSLTVNSPGLLAVSPAGGLSASGTVGGPFSPGSMVYTLTNSGGSPLNWIASKGQSWLSLSADSGSLAAGASTNITVSINSGANILEAGSYSDSLAFANTSTGSLNSYEQPVYLRVNLLHVIISLTKTADARYQVSFLGEPGWSYNIQKSSDLVEWIFASVIVAGPDGTVIYEDTESTKPCFYRVTVER